VGAILTAVDETVQNFERYGGGRDGQSEDETTGLGSQPVDRSEPLWLHEVRLRAMRRVLFVREQWRSSSYPGEEHLAISHSEVDRAFTPSPFINDLASSFYRTHEKAASLSAAIDQLAQEPADEVWSHLIQTLGVAPQEENLLRLALAAAADPRLGRVFGYLEDGTTSSGATMALADQIFDTPGARVPPPSSAVWQWRLLEPNTPPGISPSSNTVFRADPSLLDTLLGRVDKADWSPGTTGRVIQAPSGGGIRSQLAHDIATFANHVLVEADPRSPVHVEAELVGPQGSGRKTLAAATSDLLQMALIAVDCAYFAEAADPELLVVREVRRALLSKAALAIFNHERLPATVRSISSACPLTFSCVEKSRSEQICDAVITVRRSYQIPALDRGQRLALWSELSTAKAPSPVENWDLRASEIRVASKALPAGQAAVEEVCRTTTTAGIDDLLTRLPTGPTWEDLIVPAETLVHLKELEAQVRLKDDVLDDWGFSRLTLLGRGTAALFSGPSGTGKTMTAQVLAAALGLDCLRIDLAGVVSKYIGDTEKQLRKVFEVCERTPALLFFDEADALFGKRTTVNDAHDRFANIEIDYVLQAMEKFNGLAILATNRKGDLDHALIRRLRFMINFVPPGPLERELLWRKCFDGAVDRDGKRVAEGIEYEPLARNLDLTGAQIKSAALAAAFMAKDANKPITMAEIGRAIRREIEKSGKVVRPGQLEFR
jgi:ATPase family associated with various cellular activities (AAA)